jgi:seryl-tRNA synthetase
VIKLRLQKPGPLAGAGFGSRLSGKNNMLDIKTIIAEQENLKRSIRERGVQADVDLVISLAAEVRLVKARVQSLQTQRNSLAKLGMEYKNADSRGRSIEIREEIVRSEIELSGVAARFEAEMEKLPNFLSSRTPLGVDDNENLVLSTVGRLREFDFQARDHLELAESLGIVDFESGTRVAGPKFYFLLGNGVRLSRALESYAIDFLSDRGYSPIITPDVAKTEVQKGSGFNPRGDEENIYSISGSDLSLIATSEITIGGYLSDRVLTRRSLPIKLAGISHCFRREAGSAGKASKGLYRVHQFSKVEMYQVVHPSESAAALEEIRSTEEELYASLGIPFRVVSVCAGDLGAPAYEKYDIEAWMPGMGPAGQYGEVTSASNCTDFQARRLNIRFMGIDDGDRGLAHTLNGTAIATTRTILAILENYQMKDGSVEIPEVLRPYMRGLTVLKPE